MGVIEMKDTENGVLTGFISYSHDDVQEVVSLKNELAEMTQAGLIDIWYDRKIDAGTKWSPLIESQLNASDIVIFCISASFLKSDSCRKEFRRAIELKRESFSEIIPIILKDCGWKDDKEISEYQAIPEYGNPVESFSDKAVAYSQIRKSLAKKINIILRRKSLRHTAEFEKELQSLDPLLNVSSSDHVNLRLEDIFVDLELSNQDANEKEIKTVQGADLLGKLIDGQKILLSGDSQSGKTSLCKKLCIDLFGKCYFPVYFSGKDCYEGDAEKKLRRLIGEQYSDPDCIPDDRVIYILDNFYRCRKPDCFLASISKCRSVILVVNDVYSLNMRHMSFLKDYAHFSILQLRARKRDELIDKWLVANSPDGRVPFDNYKTHDMLVRRVDTALGKIFGKGLIPSYPFYILSILIISENAGAPINPDISSQGYCYQALLYAVLRRVKVPPQHIDIYINFLTELAYMLFKECNHGGCTEDQLNVFVSKYKEKFNLPISPKNIFETLGFAKIFTCDSFAYYDFSYPYLKYYFIAKYLSEHYGDCREDLDRIFSHLGKTSNAYIAIFIAHHSRNVPYLEYVEDKTKAIFGDLNGCYLTQKDMRGFDEQSQLILKAVLPEQGNNPDFEREKILEQKEKMELIESQESDEDEDDIVDATIKDTVVAIRLCQVMGQIIKSRPGSIPLDIQTKLVRSIIGVYAQIIRVFFNTFNDKASQNAIIEYISYCLQKHGKDGHDINTGNTLREKATKLFWNINFITTYAMVVHCAYAIGSNELIGVIKSVCGGHDNLPLMSIVSYAVEIMFAKRLSIDGIKKVFPLVPLTVQNMFRFLIARFCHTHRVAFNDRQRVEKLFNLPPTLPLYIKAQK